MTSKEKIIDIIRIINSEHIGPVTFYKLLAKYGTVKGIIQNKSSFLLDYKEAESVYESCLKKGIEIITYNDNAYPQNLKLIDDAPPLIYAKGNTDILGAPCIAIVGTRNASINGRKTAARIAYDLTMAGRCVISGMARGIDTSAHKGAMFALEQRGPTIAVLGTGVDIAYPKENKDLYNQIIRQGCVISEFPPSTTPQANNFPRRNRIIAAIAQATIVVEASLKSGSLITAQKAIKYGRQIFAVPGTPVDGRASGANKLIKDGALLIENAQDVISHLGKAKNKIVITKPKKQLEISFDEHKITPKHQNQKIKIIDYLNFDGVYVDEIIRASGMDAAEVALRLLELEMDGKIQRLPGNKVALIK